MHKVLFVTENSKEAQDLKNIFAKLNSKIQINEANSFTSAIKAIKTENFSAIITHTNIGKDSVPNLLTQIQHYSKRLPVVLITEDKIPANFQNLYTINSKYVISKTADYLNKLPKIVSSVIEEKNLLSFGAQLDLKIIQNVDNPIIVTDLDSKILFCNRAAESLFGWSLEEATENFLDDILQVKFGSNHTDKKIASIIKNEAQWYGEISITAKNQNILYIDLKLRQIVDENGNKVASVGSYIDITDKKENEKRLHLLSNVVLNVTDGIIITDLDENIIFVNESKANMTGYTCEELTGKHISIFSGSETKIAAKMDDAHEQLLSNKNWTGELEEVTKDGRHIIIHLSDTVLYNDEGKPYGIVGVSQDITAHKKLEYKLKESEEWHRTLVESINGILIFLDKNGNIEYINKPAEALFGYQISEVKGKKYSNLFSDAISDTKGPNNTLLKILKGDSLKGYHTTIRNRSGEIRHIIFNISPRYNAEGAIIGTIANGLDITELKILERQVAESNNYIQNIIENSADGIATYDLEAKIVTWNKACERIYGYTANEIIGKQLSITVPEEYLAEWRNICNKVREGYTFNNIDVERLRKDGSRINLFITVSPIRDLSGKMIGISSFIKDVTEKKLLEKQAYLSEIKYRQLFEESKDFVFESSSNGKFISLNQTGVEMLGYSSKEEVLELNIVKDIYANSADRERYKSEIAEKGFVIDFELQLKKKSGDRITLIETANAVYDDNNNIIGYRGIGRDITEKKIHEERILSLLVASQALSRSTSEVEIFDTIAKAIRRLGHHLIILLRDANRLKIVRTTFDADVLKGTEKLNGFRFDQISIPVKQYVRLQNVIEYKKTIFNEDTIESLISLLSQYIPKEFARTILHEVGFKDRSIYLPLIVFNDVIGIAIINSDEFKPEDIPVFNLYSAQLNAALENAKLYSRLTKANADLKKAYEKLHESQNLLIHSEKLKAIGDLASGVAHDFNNLLGVIVGRTQLILLRATEQKIKNDLDIILKAALDGAETVKRLQDFAKQKVEDNASAIDVNMIIEDTIQLTQTKWKDYSQQRGVKIEVKKELDHLPIVLGSGAELREALTNLILNAVDAMPNGGTLTIRSINRDRLFSIEVQDTGIGMDEQTKAKIFDPFFSTKGDKGTGLGLAMVKTLVTKRQGDISVKSQSGAGTTFTMTFPKVNIENEIQSITSPMPPPPESREKTNQLSVLIIDDEEELRILLAEILREADYQVVLAADGKEGIEKFKSNKIDIVFTDLGMPEMNGWQVAKTVKTMNKNVPVILISGWGRDLKDQDIVNTGVDFLASKPFHIDEIFKLLIQAKQRLKKAEE
jgi:PAS domain S-box-containing protein